MAGHNMYNSFKYVGDAGAVSVVTATTIGWLPSLGEISYISTTLTIIYVSINIAASVSKWLERREFSRGPKGKKGPPGPIGPAGPQGDKGSG